MRLPLHQTEIQSFALLYEVRAPGCVRTLRAMTSASPVPLAAATEENIHAQCLLNPKFEFIQPAGTTSFFHVIPCENLGENFDLDVLR